MKLETSRDLLERLRAKYRSSWWGLTKVLPIAESTVNNWKHGRSTIDRKFVPRIAELLDEPAEYVLACVEAERDPQNLKLWQRIAAKFRAHAASILLGLAAAIGLGSPAPSEACARALGADAPRIYIRLNWRRRWKAFVAQLCDPLLLRTNVTPAAT